ncbi:MAG: HD domain-containing protein [Candidatus Nanopelagicales bacterium]|nr:HD domain-containing protein [Candidatus Nanopelagicales bacterium]MDZ4249518.1 HD domain-containing protein [Candidatus Nanopelagicales bacterium]
MAGRVGEFCFRVPFGMRPDALYSEKLPGALAYAAVACAWQRRKDDLGTPYITHPMAVGTLVWRHGLGDPLISGELEELVIAAVLHDVPEDAGGQARLNEIEEMFGARVCQVVAAATDSLADNPATKPPWLERKQRHIASVRELASPADGLSAPDRGACLVIAADKLDNLSATAEGVARDGEGYLDRFRGGPEGTRWYYGAMFAALEPALSTNLVAEFRRHLDALRGPHHANG